MPYKKRPVVKQTNQKWRNGHMIKYDTIHQFILRKYFENMENAPAFIWTEGKKQETDL